MDTLKHRLLEVAHDQGQLDPVPNRYFEELLGLSSGRIAQLFKEGSLDKLGPKALSRLVDLGYRPDWIQNGKRPKRLSPSSDTNQDGQSAKSIASNVESAPALGALRRVPVVGTAQLGDNGYWAELETPVGFGDGFVEVAVRDSNAYALRCKGDSMKPRIKDGEFVIVEPNQTPCPGDEVLVKAKDGRVMVKELLYVRDDIVHLLSVNETHGKLSIPLADMDCMHLVSGIMKRAMWRPD